MQLPIRLLRYLTRHSTTQLLRLPDCIINFMAALWKNERVPAIDVQNDMTTDRLILEFRGDVPTWDSLDLSC